MRTDHEATLGAVHGMELTRRRALLLGAGTLAAAALPAPALARATRRAPRSAGLTVTPAAFDGGRVSRVLRAPRRFHLLGVRGAPAGLQVRARARGGEWTRWVALGSHDDHGPDGRSRGGRPSEPVWTGAADELQLRARRPVRGSLRVHLVTAAGVPSARSRRRSMRAAHAAQGSVQPPPIIPRSAWGGDSVPPRSAPSYGQVQLAFVHHTVTANEYAPEDAPGIVLSIAKYHRDVNGWNDIGYNLLVDRYGQVFEGRAGGVDQAVVGAQTAGYNSQSTGVAVIGTFEGVPADAPAMDALARLLGWKLSVHGVPVQGQVAIGSRVFERISGHRDGYPTACPGAALYGQLPALREQAARFAGTVVVRASTSLAAAASAVPYGHGARFSGVVRRDDGTAGAGEVVTVEKRGTRGWVRMARATADAEGVWVAEVPWRRSGAVRARAVGVTSKAVEVAVLPRVGTRSIPRRVRAGRAPLLRGTIRPGVPVSVLVERQTPSGRWVRAGTIRARVRGTRWEVRVPLRRPALYRLTATTGARDGSVRGRTQYLRAVRGRRGRSGGASPPGTTPPATGAPGGTPA